MRLRTPILLLALGLAARTVVRYQRTRRARRGSGARWDDLADLAPDPGDPVQGFDEVIELQLADVDALSIEDIAAAEDLAGLEAALDGAALDEAALDLDVAQIDFALAADRVDLDDIVVASPSDGGDLYGVHTPIAVDRVHPDADHAAIDGQSWLEALETSAIENGVDPERELDDIVDDEDILRAPHPSNRHDTPVADYGAGGRRGL